TLVAVVFASVMAFASLYAFLRPRPSFAIVLTLLAFLVLSNFVRIRLIGTANGFTAPQPVQRGWVDTVVAGGSVALFGGPGTSRLAPLDTAAGPDAIARPHYTCPPPFGHPYGPRPAPACAPHRPRTAAD